MDKHDIKKQIPNSRKTAFLCDESYSGISQDLARCSCRREHRMPATCMRSIEW